MWTKDFWKGAAERGIKTIAQTALAYFVIGTTGILDIDWVALGSVSAAAGLASLLTSIASPSFVAGKDEKVVQIDLDR
jgi:hypothetical protein